MRTLKGKRSEDMVLPIDAALAPRGRGVPRLHRRPLWRSVGRLALLPQWIGTAGALGFLALTLGYGIVGVQTYVPEANEPVFAVLLAVRRVGFEGPDHRFIAVTGRL